MHGSLPLKIKPFFLIPLFSVEEKREHLTAVIPTASCTAHFDMRNVIKYSESSTDNFGLIFWLKFIYS